MRKEMRATRRAVTADERAEASATICEKLAAYAGLGEDQSESAPPVAVYLASKDEIDLRAFIERMLRLGRKIVAPRWNGETYDLAVLKGLGTLLVIVGHEDDGYEACLRVAPQAAAHREAAHDVHLCFRQDDIGSVAVDLGQRLPAVAAFVDFEVVAYL